jgi:hypothetical protein
MSKESENHQKQSRLWIAFAVFAAAIGVMLVYEHRMHVFTGDAVLIGLLAACIGVHLFMHAGHGRHGGHRRDKE